MVKNISANEPECGRKMQNLLKRYQSRKQDCAVLAIGILSIDNQTAR